MVVARQLLNDSPAIHARRSTLRASPPSQGKVRISPGFSHGVAR